MNREDAISPTKLKPKTVKNFVYGPGYKKRTEFTKMELSHEVMSHVPPKKIVNLKPSSDHGFLGLRGIKTKT
jgi:hypothetical protein